MLNDFHGADRVFLATGFTDLRRGIDGLAAIVQQQFELNPFTNTLFLFCGRRRDRIKALYWEGDGFVLLYKRLESGSFQWPRSETEARALTPQQYRWLMTAEIDQLKKKVEAQQAELEAKSAELAQALLQNQWLTEQLLVKKRKIFGSSSEVLDQMVMEQFAHLFNEAECWDAAGQKPAAKAEKKPRKRRSSGSVEDIIPEGTPVEVVEHRLPEEERICGVCGSEMVEIGKEIRRTLQMEPPRFWVREDWYYTYACKHCEQETGEAVIEATPMEPAVLPGSFASPSAIAHIAVQKYVMYSPLYRLEKEYERQGLKLSRQTMSNWLLSASEDWLEPIYDTLHAQLCRQHVLHADETTLQVLHEKDKSAKSKSYMWLYRTSGDAAKPIVLYDYQPNRKAENAEAFLNGFTGWLHADGYQGYHRLPTQIRVVGCLAHARRNSTKL